MTAAACTSLILGGARSGKSAFAERLATGSGLERHYLATGQPYDDEMRERIARHRADRGDGWVTHEVTLDLVGELERTAASDRVLLVDCLTLWLTNLMMADADIEAAGKLLIDSARKWQGKLVLVSNEVGMGIVPENRMAREFRDHAGRLHQGLAAVADEVYFVVAGLPLKMKG